MTCEGSSQSSAVAGAPASILAPGALALGRPQKRANISDSVRGPSSSGSSPSRSARAGRRARRASGRTPAISAAAVDLYTEAGLRRRRRPRAPAPRRRRARRSRSASPSAPSAAQVAETDAVRAQGPRAQGALAFDTLRKSGGSFLESEVIAVGRELEDAGELERAADAYALAGDHDAEVRALTAAGAIERLEARLRASERATQSERASSSASAASPTSTAPPSAAPRSSSAARPSPSATMPRVADAARSIRARLAPRPGGRPGDRRRAPPLRARRRRHHRPRRRHHRPRLARGEPAPPAPRPAAPRASSSRTSETRNGTPLAGARIAGPIPVGDGLRSCCSAPRSPAPFTPLGLRPTRGACVAVEIAGWRYLAPLGDLRVGGWRSSTARTRGRRTRTWCSPRRQRRRARPHLGDYQLASRVELCHGDEIRAERGGPVRLAVPASHARSFGEEDTFAPFAG